MWRGSRRITISTCCASASTSRRRSSRRASSSRSAGSERSNVRRLISLLAACGTLAAATALAQQQTQTTTADPIQCWWRTSAGAVRVGEPFTLVLPSAVLGTGDVKVVPDQSKLEPAVVQFAPFEVTGGAHGVDLRTDDRRFFQYEYKLRVIAENLFGKDVALPETKLNYRVQSKTGQGTSIEGRDQVY